MKLTILHFLILIAFGIAAFNSFGKPADVFEEANEQYRQNKFSDAAALYEKLVHSGNISPDLFYNLGNAYYKNGDVAKSILYFEKALKLNPADDDIQFNLNIARLKTVDKIEPIPQLFYKRWLFRLTDARSLNFYSMALLVSVWVLWLLAVAYLLSRSTFRKRLSFILAFIFLLTSILIFVLFRIKDHRVNKEHYGIIQSLSVFVKSSPDEKGNDLFIIHEGTKVEIIEQLEDWNRIRLANGNQGWIKQADFLPI